MVNPELGLVINGGRHIIKLFLKSDPLSAFKTELIIDLMEHQLRSKAQDGDKFCVLDVRNSKIFMQGPHEPTAMNMVEAEIAYIASLWSI